MDFKKILTTITSGEKSEELLKELKEKSGGLQDLLKEKGGGLQDLLLEKLKGNSEQSADEQTDNHAGGLESILGGKLKDLADKAKSEIESKIKK